MGKQSRRLTGFRIGMFDMATGTFSSHSVRAKNLAGFPALIDAVSRAQSRQAGAYPRGIIDGAGKPL